MRDMTIREFIKRRFRNLALTFALAYAVLQILGICIRHWPDSFTAKPWLLVLGLAAPSALWIIIVWFAIKVMTIACPRCSRPLSGAALAAVFGNKKVTRCPQCRVSLDEPVKGVDPN
jgi:putative copper export protein